MSAAYERIQALRETITDLMERAAANSASSAKMVDIAMKALNTDNEAARTFPQSFKPRTPLEDAAQIVHDHFKRDIDQGYRTRDKVYAVEMLGRHLIIKP